MGHPVILMGIFKIIVNKLFYKNFITIFTENIKSCKKKLIVFFFTYKKFLKIFYKLMFLRYLLTFLNYNLQ